MKFYPFDIADFRGGTGHLSRIQRSLYRELLDIYYDKELPFPTGEIAFERMARRLACNTLEEKQDLDLILDEFFPIAADGLRHNERADLEIAKFHAFIESGRRGGINSGMSRRARNEAKGGSSSLEAQSKGGSTPVEGGLPIASTNENKNEKEKENKKEKETSASTKPPLSEVKELECIGGSAGETPAQPAKLRRPSRKCPAEWRPNEKLVQWAITEQHVREIVIAQETDKFKDHTFSRAISDWDAAWRNWIRNSKSFSKPGKGDVLERNLDVADRFGRESS